MTTETKTLWKKNLDSNFISGEDLKSGLKGLRSEMVVYIDRFKDDETFDNKTQSKKIITGLYLKELNGTPLYKPAILNKTNAKFFVKECGSDYVDDWLNKPVVMCAVADSRHGYVVRFRKYTLPELLADTEAFKNCKTALDSGKFTIAQIKAKYQVSGAVEKLLLVPPIPAKTEITTKPDIK